LVTGPGGYLAFQGHSVGCIYVVRYSFTLHICWDRVLWYLQSQLNWKYLKNKYISACLRFVSCYGDKCILTFNQETQVGRLKNGESNRKITPYQAKTHNLVMDHQLPIVKLLTILVALRLCTLRVDQIIAHLQVETHVQTVWICLDRQHSMDMRCHKCSANYSIHVHFACEQ
jgi:hypothetical protein